MGVTAGEGNGYAHSAQEGTDVVLNSCSLPTMDWMPSGDCRDCPKQWPKYCKYNSLYWGSQRGNLFDRVLNSGS
jgi:hypothetical protein